MDFIFYIIFLVCIFDIVSAGEYCYSVRGGLEYCKYDCCGSTFDEHCCPVYTWIIVLAVIGGLIAIGVCVCVFCMMKKKGKNGRVVGTGGTSTNVTTFYSGQPNAFNQPPYQPPPPGPFAQQGQFGQQGPFAQQGQFGQQGFAQPGQPAYPPPSALQQNYGQDNPAYPPPPKY